MFLMWLAALAGVLTLGAPASSTPGGYKIIVNRANPTDSLTRTQLSRMFLDASTWPDGQPVLPVDLAADSPVREVFSKTVHGMSTAAVVARAANAPQRGRGAVTLHADADAIQYVRLKLGAIAYVSPTADVSTVKVISIDTAAQVEGTTAGSETQIQGLVAKYTSALENRDLVALQRIWPTMNPAQLRAMRAEFEQTKVVRVEMVEPRIDVRADRAVVVATRRQLGMTTSGTTMRIVTVTTLNLRQAPGGWYIEDIRYQAQP